MAASIPDQAGWDDAAGVIDWRAMRKFVVLIGFLAAAAGPGARAQDVNACIDRCFSNFSPSQMGGSTELREECLQQCHGPKIANGAIAYGAKSTANGYAWGKSSKAEADRTAMVNCQKNGNDCKIVADFSNSCEAVAAVESKGRFSTGGGRSQAEAQNNAMKSCKAQIGGSCEIEVWTCAGGQ